MTRPNKHQLLRLFLFFALFIVALPTMAQENVSDDEVNEVAKDLFCPVCESTPLDVCPTQACEDWRELIRTKLGEGQTKEEIHDYFARQYGDGVLADPPKRGFNLILWVLPIIALIVGGVFFGRYLKTLRVAGQQANNVATTADPPPPVQATNNNHDSTQTVKDETTYLNQVEEELKKL